MFPISIFRLQWRVRFSSLSLFLWCFSYALVCAYYELKGGFTLVRIFRTERNAMQMPSQLYGNMCTLMSDRFLLYRANFSV